MAKAETSQGKKSEKKTKTSPVVVMDTDPDRERKTEYIGFRWTKTQREQLAAAKQVTHMAEGDFLLLCFQKARKQVIDEVFEERKQAAAKFFGEDD